MESVADMGPFVTVGMLTAGQKVMAAWSFSGCPDILTKSRKRQRSGKPDFRQQALRFNLFSKSLS